MRQVVESKLESRLAEHHALKDEDERQPWLVMTIYLNASFRQNLVTLTVKISKVRDRSNSGIKFNSKLVLPYLERAKNVLRALPSIYLHRIST